jgi:signal transduction histidine kinase
MDDVTGPESPLRRRHVDRAVTTPSVRALPGVEQTAAGRERGAARRLLAGAVPYVLSAASVGVALVGALTLEQKGFRTLEFPLFLFAIASTVWYPGVGPAIVAVALSTAAFDYYFTEPRHRFVIAADDVPYFVAFVLFAAMLTGFSIVRRRTERQLLESRARLQAEVAQRRAREDQIGRLNEQLERRSADLEASNGELEAFAYSISHDLRAPLRHMAGFAELLQQHGRSALDDKSQRYVAIILEAARRMGQLIDDLLAFSRIGRVETQATTVSLAQLVKEVVEELRPEIGSREVSWSIGELPTLHGDRSMLRLVLANLLANALKFTRTRERAEIAIGSFDDPERGVVVFTKDNGVGFDMKYYNKLFRVFQRLHRSEEFEGTGIGLATVQRVIQRHGGTVWAEGAVNGGATFYFSVPSASRR